MRIIGLHGRKGAGKDQAFEYIRQTCEAEGLVATRAALADPLKLSAAASLGIKPEHALDFCNLVKRDGYTITVRDPNNMVVAEVTGRQFLQNYGTEAHREIFGDSFWINATLPIAWDSATPTSLLEEKYPDTDVLVITDVRFHNEAERVWDLGGEVWYINRPEAEVGDQHASEQKLDLIFDVTIDNDGGLDVLANRVIEAL